MIVLQKTNHADFDITSKVEVAAYTATGDQFVAVQVEVGSMSPSPALITTTLAMGWEQDYASSKGDQTAWFSKVRGPVHLSDGEQLKVYLHSTNTSDTLVGIEVTVLDVTETTGIAPTDYVIEDQNITTWLEMGTYTALVESLVLFQVELSALFAGAAVITVRRELFNENGISAGVKEYSFVKGTETVCGTGAIGPVALTRWHQMTISVMSTNVNDTLVSGKLKVRDTAQINADSPGVITIMGQTSPESIRSAVGMADADLDDQLVGISSAMASLDVQDSVEAGLAEFGAAKTGDEMQLEAAVVTTIRNGLSTLTAQQVWEYGTRSLTTFGTLVSSISTAVWAAVTRTLTAGTKDEAIDSIKEKTDKLSFTGDDVQAVASNALDAAGVRSAIGMADADLDAQLSLVAKATDEMVLTTAEKTAIREGLALEATSQLIKGKTSLLSFTGQGGALVAESTNAATPGDEMSLTEGALLAVKSGLALEATSQSVKGKTDQLDFTGSGGALISESTNMRGTDNAMLAANYTPPDNEAISQIQTKVGNLPNEPAAKGDAMALTLAERNSIRDGLALETTVTSLGNSISELPANVWAFATASMTVVGSVGKWLVDKLGLTGQFDFSGSGGTLRTESTNMRGTDGAATPGDEMRLVISEKSEIRDGLALGSDIDALNNISSQDVESALTAFGTAKATDVSESESGVLQGVTAAREAVIVEIDKTNARITEDRAVKLDNLDKKSSDIYDKLLEVEHIAGEIQISGILDVDGFTAGGILTIGELLTKLNAFVSGKVEVVGLSPLRFRVYDDDADPNITGSGTALFDLEQHSGGRTPR